jgi:hypothetical protein
MQDQIESFWVLSFQGTPVGPQEFLEVLARPGVDGLAFWKTGIRGKPFTLRSKVDLVDLEQAVIVFSLYQQLVGADPVGLTWGGIQFGGYGYAFKVLDVRCLRAAAIAGCVGGLSPPSRGWLEAEWDLVAVRIR